MQFVNVISQLFVQPRFLSLFVSVASRAVHPSSPVCSESTFRTSFVPTVHPLTRSACSQGCTLLTGDHSSVSLLADFRALTAFRALSLARSIADRTSGVSAPSWNALIVFECSMCARRFARRLGASNGVFIPSWSAAVPQTGQPGLPQSPSPSVSFGHATLFRNRLSTASRASWSVSRRFGSLV